MTHHATSSDRLSRAVLSIRCHCSRIGGRRGAMTTTERPADGPRPGPGRAHRGDQGRWPAASWPRRARRPCRCGRSPASSAWCRPPSTATSPAATSCSPRSIVDAYDAVGDAAEAAEPPVARADVGGALAGDLPGGAGLGARQPAGVRPDLRQPVPGYAAPQDTIDPAARIPALLLAVRRRRRGRRARSVAADAGRPLPRRSGATSRPCATEAAPELDDVRWRGPSPPGRSSSATHQLRAVRPPAQRDPRLRRPLRPPDADDGPHRSASTADQDCWERPRSTMAWRRASTAAGRGARGPTTGRPRPRSPSPRRPWCR